MRRLSSIPALAALAVAIPLLLTGCSESACEEAERKGKATHACYAENKKAERELKEAEYGSLGAAEEAERQDEIQEEVEEVEEVLKREQAEETARALRELEGR